MGRKPRNWNTTPVQAKFIRRGKMNRGKTKWLLTTERQ